MDRESIWLDIWNYDSKLMKNKNEKCNENNVKTFKVFLLWPNLTKYRWNEISTNQRTRYGYNSNEMAIKSMIPNFVSQASENKSNSINIHCTSLSTHNKKQPQQQQQQQKNSHAVYQYVPNSQICIFRYTNWYFFFYKQIQVFLSQYLYWKWNGNRINRHG